MTPCQQVYDAFLAKVNDDEWGDEIEFFYPVMDWHSLLESAIPYFYFPRVSLEMVQTESITNDDGESIPVYSFVADLNNLQIQILSSLMKIEWYDRTISSWENLKSYYSERDFSPAKFLDSLENALSAEQKKVKKLQKMYSRSIPDEEGVRRPYKYSNLSGGVRD